MRKKNELCWVCNTVLVYNTIYPNGERAKERKSERTRKKKFIRVHIQ